MSKEQITRIAESWDKNSGAWTDAVRKQALESRRLVTDQSILDTITALPGKRVLDIGCGEGWLSYNLWHSGFEVVGFDGSKKLIDQAKGNPGPEFLVLDYNGFTGRPDRAGENFNTAVCNFSILADDIQPFLKSIKKVLSAEGHLVIQTVHPAAVAGDEKYENGWREEMFGGLPGSWFPMPWYFRTISSWIKELRSAGWAIHNCIEPVHPETGQPASLILVGVATAV